MRESVRFGFPRFDTVYSRYSAPTYVMGLIIRSSSIHAAGCYTTSAIRKDTRVVEYTGPIIDKDEGDRRYEGKPITYLFGIGDGTRVIDGHGVAMFINHSCDANCETEEIEDHVWITAIRDISPGEELCYDYCLYDGDEDEAPCNCGAKNCRGSMFSPEELQRRARANRKRTESNHRTNQRPLNKQVRTDNRSAKRPAPAKKQAKEVAESSGKKVVSAKRKSHPSRSGKAKLTKAAGRKSSARKKRA